ncbi:MAG: hypothetical protein K0U84_14820 [Actinomycetia bacterium]|nr:hypothetical protein [Actinomycetes bacterium]
MSAPHAAERWFLDRGLPSVLTRAGLLRAVWSRSAPGLAGFATVAVCLLLIYLLTGHPGRDIPDHPITKGWVELAVIVLALPLAGAVGWIVARMTTNRAQFIASAVAAGVAVSAAVIGDEITWGLTAGVIVLMLALTASGIGSVLGWAVRLTLWEFSAVGALLMRSLPMVLLTFLVFFNTPMWQMASHESRPRMWMALAFLFIIACAFLVSGTLERVRPLMTSADPPQEHADQLVGTPFEQMPDLPANEPLNLGERVNVVFVITATQIVQVSMVAAVTAGIFFVLGLILLNPGVLAAWSEGGSSHGTVFGMDVPVPNSLIQIVMFMAALTFMNITARAVGDGEYRSQYLDPLIDDLKVTLLARNRYRHVTSQPKKTN